jgi:hypothetical protein
MMPRCSRLPNERVDLAGVVRAVIPPPRQLGLWMIHCSYATLGLTLLGAVVVFVGAFSANRLLRPRRPAPTPGKYENYECGLELV